MKKINPELVYLVVSSFFIPTKKIQISKEHALVFSGNGIGLNASFDAGFLFPLSVHSVVEVSLSWEVQFQVLRTQASPTRCAVSATPLHIRIVATLQS